MNEVGEFPSFTGIILSVRIIGKFMKIENVICYTFFNIGKLLSFW